MACALHRRGAEGSGAQPCLRLAQRALVPRYCLSFEAGDVVPADARLQILKRQPAGTRVSAHRRVGAHVEKHPP